MLHDEDSKMLMLRSDDKRQMVDVDLLTGQVVSEFVRHMFTKASNPCLTNIQVIVIHALVHIVDSDFLLFAVLERRGRSVRVITCVVFIKSLAMDYAPLLV